MIVFEDREFEAEYIENPEHFKGISRIGAFLFEMLDPYSGNSLEMVRQIVEVSIGKWAILFYFLKPVLRTVLPMFMKG